MKIDKKTRLSLLLTLPFFFAQCSFNDMLREPEKSGDRPGSVAFCTYVKGNTYMGAESRIRFAQKSGDGFTPVELPIAHGKNKELITKNILAINDFCYVVTGLVPGNEYALVYSHHSWRETTSSTTNMGTGQTTYNKSDFEADLFFNAGESFSAMPIRVEPGKIRFLGVYEITPSRNNTGKWNSVLRPNLDAGYFINAYIFDNGEITLRGAERRVLSWLGMRHKSDDSYWKPIIDKRLAELK